MRPDQWRAIHLCPWDKPGFTKMPGQSSRVEESDIAGGSAKKGIAPNLPKARTNDQSQRRTWISPQSTKRPRCLQKFTSIQEIHPVIQGPKPQSENRPPNSSVPERPRWRRRVCCCRVISERRRVTWDLPLVPNPGRKRSTASSKLKAPRSSARGPWIGPWACARWLGVLVFEGCRLKTLVPGKKYLLWGDRFSTFALATGS